VALPHHLVPEGLGEVAVDGPGLVAHLLELPRELVHVPLRVTKEKGQGGVLDVEYPGEGL
jgi:hypothetical protein